MNIIHPEKLPQWPGLVDAMNDVHGFALRTGREKIIVLNPQGKAIWTAEGTENEAPLDQHGDYRGAYIVHSHPEAAPLSIMDFGVVGAFQAAGIIATMPDGGWSASTGLTFHIGKPLVGFSKKFLFVLDRTSAYGEYFYEQGLNDTDAGISASFRIIDEAFVNGAIKDHTMVLGPAGERALHLVEQYSSKDNLPLRLE